MQGAPVLEPVRISDLIRDRVETVPTIVLWVGIDLLVVPDFSHSYRFSLFRTKPVISRAEGT